MCHVREGQSTHVAPVLPNPSDSIIMDSIKKHMLIIKCWMRDEGFNELSMCLLLTIFVFLLLSFFLKKELQ
jgi:hypothetical protein